MVIMKRGNLDGIDPGDIGAVTYYKIGTARAAAAGFTEEATCEHCGAQIRHLFVGAYVLGGDCLATLTGDDSTRSAVARAAKKHGGKGVLSVFTLLGAVFGRKSRLDSVCLRPRPWYITDRSLGSDVRPEDQVKARTFAAAMAQALDVELESW